MTLQSELGAFRCGWEARVGVTIAQLIGGDIEDLRASGILDRAARAGDALPIGTALLDQHGGPFDLAALVAAKAVILTYYRGGWCPYCNLEPCAYQQAQPMPATFVVDRGGRIRAAFIEPDHRRRLDPRAALDALAPALA